MTKKMDEPSIADLSETATRAAVRRRAVTENATVYTLVAGGALGALAAALFGPEVVFFAASGSAVALGFVVAAANLWLRGDTFAHSYIARVHRALEEHRKRVFTGLKRQMEELSTVPGADDYTNQGIKQFDMVERRLVSFGELLREKLNAGELTFGRYLGTAEQACGAVLDNLREIVAGLTAIKDIDPQYIEERFRALKVLKALDQSDKEEMATLAKRKTIREERLNKINKLLTLNEEAITAIDQAADAIADMKTGERASSIDLETARTELEDIVRRAKAFA